jgi:hypothetical protein
MFTKLLLALASTVILLSEFSWTHDPTHDCEICRTATALTRLLLVLIIQNWVGPHRNIASNPGAETCFPRHCLATAPCCSTIPAFSRYVLVICHFPVFLLHLSWFTLVGHRTGYVADRPIVRKDSTFISLNSHHMDECFT